MDLICCSNDFHVGPGRGWVILWETGHLFFGGGTGWIWGVGAMKGSGTVMTSLYKDLAHRHFLIETVPHPYLEWQWGIWKSLHLDPGGEGHSHFLTIGGEATIFLWLWVGGLEFVLEFFWNFDLTPSTPTIKWLVPNSDWIWKFHLSFKSAFISHPHSCSFTSRKACLTPLNIPAPSPSIFKPTTPVH